MCCRYLRSVRHISALILGLLAAAAAIAAAATFGRGTLTQALGTLEGVHPGWLLLAIGGFGVALVCSAMAWGAGLRACGGEAPAVDVAARYSVGSLVNSFSPAHLGGAVRIGLLSRTLPGDDAVLRTCGVGAAVGAARALVLAVLVFAAAAFGDVPLWPAPIVVLVVLALLWAGTRWSKRVAGHVASALEAFRSPRTAVDLTGWVACSFAGRLGASVAVVLALGIPHPLAVALVMLAALALAGLLPLTPGNFGAGAGAATLALHGTGVGVGTALGLGMTFQAAETCTAFLFGLAGSATLATPGTRLRRWSVAAAGVAVLALATSVGVVTVDLV